MRMRRHYSMAVMVLLNMLAGCCEDQDAFTSGTYYYRGYDLNGQEIAIGEMIITVNDFLINDRKNIRITATNMESLLDAGKGTIDGKIDTYGIVHIRLTFNRGPNMILLGHYRNGKLTGERIFESLTGDEAVGTFGAAKVR